MATVTLGKEALIDADLIIASGVTFKATFRYLKEGDEGPVPIDMSGWSSYMDFCLKTGEKVLDADDSVVTDENGNIIVYLRPEVTARLDPGTYKYDIILEDDIGDRVRLSAGKAKIVRKYSEAG